MIEHVSVFFEDSVSADGKNRILNSIKSINGVGLATVIIDEYGNWPTGIQDTMNITDLSKSPILGDCVLTCPKYVEAQEYVTASLRDQLAEAIGIAAEKLIQEPR